MKRTLNRILFILLTISITGPPICQAVTWTETTAVEGTADILFSPRIAEDGDGNPNILYTTQKVGDPDPIFWIRHDGDSWSSARTITYDENGSTLESFSSFDFEFDGDGNL